MSEKPSSMRTWLARYKPDKVRVTKVDGSQVELPRPAVDRGQWAQLEHAIALHNPSYIEAFRNGECIASRSLEVEQEEQTQQVVPIAGKMAELVSNLPVLAQLFIDSADAATQRQEHAYKMAFEAMLEQNKQYLQLVQVVGARLGGLEKAWHEMLMARQQEAAQGGGENDAAAMQLIGNIIRGQPNGASASAKPNGAAKPEGEPQ